MLHYSDVFHVGIRVRDLDESMRSIGEALGLTWAEPVERSQRVWTPGSGEAAVDLRFTYSTEGPQRVELLQGAAGSLWDADDAQGPGLHHSGVFVESVADAAERLLAAGWTLLGAGRPPEKGYGTFGYLRSPGGFVVEPVDVAQKGHLERWWAGGAL